MTDHKQKTSSKKEDKKSLRNNKLSEALKKNIKLRKEKR